VPTYNREVRSSNPSPFDNLKPNPRAMQRMIYIGFPEDSPMLLLRIKENSAVYDSLEEVPHDEMPPAFVWINGKIATDDQIKAFLSRRVWHPIMIRVVGRWLSRCQSFFGLTGAWVIAATMAMALFIVVGLIVFIKNQF